MLVSAASHGYLYLHGYSSIPAIGRGFLVLTSVFVALAILIAVGGPVWLRAVALMAALGSLGAFVMSRTIGLQGFIEHGWQPAPHAFISVLAEAITVALCGWSLVRSGSAVPRTRTAAS
ncbi:hypothetical protein Y900_016870 [Mycolicibacterium aromaticivorans JS19b1 = JCM 16368]|uniref:DUF4345 domain-containing protein n=1 Tax=Mycolicibacterium aromaticivorans JS19b1 = JCM 16368 TaxID=1440774 RepID=A0A064CIZ8_9MYCO|nr:hypothetical protein Y900_016870 [Mycolicibacterium aromaticivorans JS19b1 = JCM 16368]